MCKNYKPHAQRVFLERMEKSISNHRTTLGVFLLCCGCYLLISLSSLSFTSVNIFCDIFEQILVVDMSKKL